MNFERSYEDSKSNIRHLRKYGYGGTFLDLGANVGFVSEAALQRFNTVIAVEAHPVTCRQAYFRLDGAATVINAAVMAESGKTAFVSSPENSIGASARLEKRLKRDDDYYKDVETLAFNGLLEKYNPRVFKMDIEGSEYECIDSCHFNKNLEFFQIEYHGTRSLIGFEKFKSAEDRIKSQGFERFYPLEINMTDEGFPKSFFFICCYRKNVK